MIVKILSLFTLLYERIPPDADFYIHVIFIPFSVLLGLFIWYLFYSKKKREKLLSDEIVYDIYIKDSK
jgi:hypothetical protein